MRKSMFIMLLVGAVPSFTRAQDSLATTTLREVVISATRAEESVIEIPRSVTVISGEVIRNAVYQSVGDLLNAEAGLYVVGANQAPGTNQNVFMRGANSNQVAVLIDGVRITDPSSPNAAIDLSELSLTNIERIEVIRGSHSTMFGGAAIGGVINLITRKDSRSGLHGDASWQGGWFGQRAFSSAESVDLSYGLPGGFHVKGSLFRQDVKNLDATLPAPDDPMPVTEPDDFRKMDGSLSTGFTGGKWEADLSFRRSHQFTEVDNGAFSDDDNYYLDFDRDMFRYRARYTVNSALQFSLLGSWSNSMRAYENDSSQVAPGTWDRMYSAGTYAGKLQTHEIQVNYERNALRGVFGAGVYSEQMTFDNYFFYNDPQFPLEVVTNYDTIDTRTATAYVFSQAAYTWKTFQLSAGGRLSHHSLAGTFLTVDVNPSLALGDLLLYGSFSTGYNAPSLYQLYDPTRNPGAYTTRGYSGLRPERSISVEVGAKKEFASGSFATLSAYRTSVEDAIEYVYLWNGDVPLDELGFADDRGDTYLNVGAQRAMGIEVAGLAQISPKVSFRGNASFVSTRVVAKAADVNAHTGGHHIQLYNLGAFLDDRVEQDQLVRRPDFTAFARLSWLANAKFSIHGDYRYTGRRFDSGFDGTLGPYGGLGRIAVEAYHLVDAGLRWEATEELQLTCKVENIFDEAYREVVGFGTRGRSVYLKAAIRW